jgi:hypothetical protein
LLAKTRLEDELTREYRALVAELPLACVVDDTPLEALVERDPGFDRDKILGIFYRYFDLSNQQLYLCMAKRITKGMAAEWQDGMRGLAEREAFGSAWRDINLRLESSTSVGPAPLNEYRSFIGGHLIPR